MNSSAPTADSSLLLIGLAAVLAVLAAHVALGWLHEAQRRTGYFGARGIAVLVAAAVLGSGLCAASLLVLAGEALSFPLGYRSQLALALWGGSIAGGALAGLVLLSSVRWWAVSLAGAIVGGTALGLHIGWVEAAGLRPGITWEPVFVAAAGALMIVGCCTGLWLNWSDAMSERRRRGAWRLGAALLIGLSIITGLELLNTGLPLHSQIGSVYLRQLPGNVLSMLGGVLLPLVLGVMAIDLRMRRRQRRQSRRHSVSASAPLDRSTHRRRHKIPTL